MHADSITRPPALLVASEDRGVHNRSMDADAASLVLLSLAWLAYAVLHSLLASLGLKRVAVTRFPRLAPAYRLLYNLIAGLALLPILWLLWHRPGPWLWRWNGPASWTADGLALLALGALAAWPAGYDLGEFLGLGQLRAHRTDMDQELFRISPLHRYVRHPWYTMSLVLLWTRDMSAARLVSALWITAYFIVGSRLEERKLLARFGGAYRDYMGRVPGLVPLPWKTLSREEAGRLEGSR